MKILFAKGNSQYGSLRHSADLIIERMKKVGHEVVVIDRAKSGDWENATNIVDESFDIVFSVQVVAYKLKDKLDQCGKYYENIAYVCFCGDPPFSFDYWFRKMKNHKKTYFIVSDYNQYVYLKKYYPYINSHIIYEVMGDGIEPLPYKSREYDVYFGGTYYDVENEKSIINSYDENDKKLAYEMIDYILDNEGIPLEGALEYVYKKNDIKVDEDTFSSQLAKYDAVDMYIRGYYRNYYISAALESNAEVTVCGANWEKSNFINNKKFHYLGSCETMEQAYINMVNSKIIINIMPWATIGFHDRLVNTLLCQAVCLTNRNKKVDEIFKDGEELIAVGLQDKKKIIDSINRIIHDDDLGAQIAYNGYIAGKNYFSFDKIYANLESILKKTM